METILETIDTGEWNYQKALNTWGKGSDLWCKHIMLIAERKLCDVSNSPWLQLFPSTPPPIFCCITTLPNYYYSCTLRRKEPEILAFHLKTKQVYHGHMVWLPEESSHFLPNSNKWHLVIGHLPYLGFPGVSVGKESACNAGDHLQCRRSWLNPWVEKIPWRRKWQPSPVFLLGKSHKQRSMAGYSP